MKYLKLRRRGNKWQVVSDSGTVLGSHTTKQAAQNQAVAVKLSYQAKGDDVPIKSRWDRKSDTVESVLAFQERLTEDRKSFQVAATVAKPAAVDKDLWRDEVSRQARHTFSGYYNDSARRYAEAFGAVLQRLGLSRKSQDYQVAMKTFLTKMGFDNG